MNMLKSMGLLTAVVVIFCSCKKESDPIAAKFPVHAAADVNVPGLGTVKEVTWTEVGGSTQAYLKNVGWHTIDFNDMNEYNLDNTTSQNAGIYMGTIDKERIEAIILPEVNTSSISNLQSGQLIGFNYQVLLSGNDEWDNWKNAGQPAGITGTNKKIKKIRIVSNRNVLFTSAPSDSLEVIPYFRGRSEDGGWGEWKVGDGINSVGNNTSPLTGLQIRLFVKEL